MAIGGVAYELDTRDLIDFRLHYVGGYQAEVVDYIAERTRGRGAVLWDVGANVGSVTLPLAARNPSLTVHAFEPSPPVFARLATNLRQNPALAGRVRVHQVALGASSGVVDFFVSNEAWNSGVGGLAPSANRSAVPVRVPASRGDDLIARGEASAPCFVKIDVEGYELEVLRGLERHLASGEIEVVFEHEPYRLRERGLDAGVVIAFLRGLGFQVRRMADPTVELEEAPGEGCDLVALRPSIGS